MCGKSLLTFITAGFYYFFVGLEFAVIIPSLNAFIRSLHGDKSVIGLCISAMSFSGLISAPVFGRVTDYIGKTKAAVIVADIFAIGGNFLYFASTTPYMIVISRLIVGVSAGVGSSVIGMLTNAVEPEKRTSLLSRIYTGRQAGLLFGPAFNFFLIYFNFNFFSFHINKYTAPGFFMVILWIIHLIMTIFCYHDLDSAPNSSSVNPDDEKTTETTNEAASKTTFKSSNTTFFLTISQDLFQEISILIMFSGFVIMFVFSAVDTILTPLSSRFFGWKEIENSIYFSSSGLLYVISLVSLSFVSKKFSDRSIYSFGMAALTFNMLLFLIFVIFAVQQPTGTHSPWMLALFITFGAIVGLTMCYAFVPSVSMFSRVTSAKNQGFNQGVFLTFRQLATILGPLWGSYLLDDLPLVAGGFFGLFFLVFVMCLTTFKRLPGREDGVHESLTNSTPVETEASNFGEKTALLSSN